MGAHAIVKVVFGAATKWSKLLSLLLPPPLRPPTLPILPPELIELILLRLPARSLLKFKSVCKSWKTLISSSDFIKNQVQLSIMAEPAISELHLVYSNIFRFNNNEIGFIPIQSLLENLSFGIEVVYFAVEGYNVNITGSCNGFLCLTNLPSFDFKVRLLNPCTGLASEWLTLHSEYDQQQRPLISTFGFGYDHVNDKFKILTVVKNSTKIYTFGAHSWITVQDIPLYTLDWDGTFVTGTGTLNWLATKIASSITYPVNQTAIVVLSFNFGNESYGQIALPNVEGGMIHREPVLVTLRNSLCVCHGYQCSGWDLWMMKEYGNEDSWTRMLVIPHEELIPHAIAIRPLHIMENDLLLVLVRPPAYGKCSQLVVYNPTNKGDKLGYPVINYYSYDDMPDYDDPLRCFRLYRESLVSPSHYGLKTDHMWL